MKKVEQMVEAAVAPVVAHLGYELADVEYRKEDGQNVLTVFIHKNGGVNIEDCEAVSGVLDPIVDALDPVEEAYFFSVSSVGLDRPLKKPADFARNAGKDVEIHLYAPIDRKKLFVGRLVDVDEQFVTIDIGGASRAFERKTVSLIRPYVTFKE